MDGVLLLGRYLLGGLSELTSIWYESWSPRETRDFYESGRVNRGMVGRHRVE